MAGAALGLVGTGLVIGRAGFGIMGILVGVISAASFYAAALGIPFSVLFLFPNAIMADIVDFDFFKTGHRREATFYSLQDTLQKFSLAASAVIFGLVLQFLGYSQDNPQGLRLMGTFAGVFVFLGFVIFAKYYNLSEAKKISGSPSSVNLK